MSINIQVNTQYIEGQSEPENDRFVFAYHIVISNRSERTCQLLYRRWVITDASGDIEEVQGEGVVGQQPTLQPGETFEYSSGAVLKTPVGAMHGAYEFVAADGQRFSVPIDAFSLSMPNIVH